MRTEELKLDVLTLWRDWPEHDQYDELDKAIHAFVDKLNRERPDVYWSGHLGYGDKYDAVSEWVHDYERE